MAADPRKRQKKLERRTAKRHEKKRQLVKEHSAGLGERLTVASKAPNLHAWITEDLWSAQGMGQVLLSRTLPNGFVAVAVFLVDRFCLGVKNAMASIITRSSYDNQFVREMRSQFEARDVSPATARKVVEAAVAYARDLGFSPHPDYLKARLLFGDINAAESTEEIEFGKDGQPMFIAGPHDTPERCRSILTTLTRTRGPDGFNYFLPAGGDFVLPEALQQGKVRLIGQDERGDLPEAVIDFGDEEI
jgi:hypothetical protein